MYWALWFAGLYNLAWGTLVILWPHLLFDAAGMARPNYASLWQCIGMIVGVYGLGYIIAAYDPARHWPIVLVGLLGKVLGPIGFVHAALGGELPWIAGWVNVTNDLIWWIPFALILWYAWSQSSTSQATTTHRDHDTTRTRTPRTAHSEPV
jgi:hypothetical protein